MTAWEEKKILIPEPDKGGPMCVAGDIFSTLTLQWSARIRIYYRL